MILRVGAIPQFVTISALIALGHIAQITYDHNSAIDSRRTQEQVREALAQLASTPVG